MKKLIIIFLFFPFTIYSQNGITLNVEELTPPTKLLKLSDTNDIYKKLIHLESGFDEYESRRDSINIPLNIIAHKESTDKLVEFGSHPFFMGMYQAYADHRPFVLSPDMIWLLISQGFAAHVNNNPEVMRKYMVNHEGKMSLIVRNDEIDLNNPNAPWEDVISNFTKKIKENTKGDLVNTIVADFTTTTPITKMASQATLMTSIKAYFQFIVIRIACGIPEITLEGTSKDWKKVLQKTKALRKYELDWWVDEMEPILEQFIDATSSDGKFDKQFWQNMFKKHTEKKYGNPTIFDGWVVKFFPYNKEGNRNNLKVIRRSSGLPNEMLQVDILYLDKDEEGNTIETPLELWAGFVGLQQNETNFALKPEIGWMIRKKNLENKALITKLEEGAKKSGWGGLSIRVDKVPLELFTLKKIKKLQLDFINEVHIPLGMKQIEIDKLKITGKISDAQIQSICTMFPNTYLIINDKGYNKAINDSDKFPGLFFF